MSYNYEATSYFHKELDDLESFVESGATNDKYHSLIIKVSIVLLVTSFQVFVESVLSDFRENLNDIPSRKLSTYIKMNSLHIDLFDEENPLIGLKKHKNFTDDKLVNVIECLHNLEFITNENHIIGNEFKFKTKFPLGKTGKTELINLVKQIDGEDEPFKNFGNDKFNKLDSLLQMRHSIVHHGRFNGTEATVKEYLSFLRELVDYIDSFLYEKYDIINKN
jgi:hypothetical protein